MRTGTDSLLKETLTKLSITKTVYYPYDIAIYVCFNVIQEIYTYKSSV